MMHRLGVVMLVNEFPPLKVGGGERQAERLAMELARQGMRVWVITRGRRDLPLYEERDGFWVRRVRPWGPGKLRSLTFTLGAMLQLWRRRAGYQIIHAHLAFAPAVAAALIGPSLGRRVIVKFGNSGRFGDVQVSQATLRGRLKLALLRRRVDVVIALEPGMQGELEAAGFAHIVRMANGIAAREFRPPAERSRYQSELGLEGREVLLYVGRLSPQKALPDLLHAARQVFRERPRACLLLVGDGPERERLQALSVELGIAARLRFVGNVAAVRPYLWAADLFVLPSLSEGMSNALLEAMAAGLPCVATRVGNAPEMLDEGRCGVLIPPGNRAQLAAALLMLLTDPQRRARLGIAAQQRVVEKYEITVVAAAYRRLYEALWNRSAFSI